MSKFISNLKNKGLEVNSTLVRRVYDGLNPLIRKYAKVVLLPVGGEENIVYAMDNKTGEIVNFNFARASSATLFDSNLDIKISEVNIPRIDYGNYGTDSKILIENSKTNLILNSVDSFSRNSVFVTENTDKYNSFSFTEADTTNQVYRLYTPANTLSLSSSVFSGSMLFKYAGRKYFQIRIAGADERIWIDTENKLMLNPGNNISNYSITLLNDEWCYITITATTNSNHGSRLIITADDKSFNTPIPSVDGMASTSLLFGCVQFEENSSTSFIPTLDAQVTRSADLLSYNLDKDCSVYLRTTKQNVVLDKQAGTWNIHEELDNEGIFEIAIFDRVLTDDEKQKILS